ncbi:MAG: hypothetical protein ACXVJZ_10525 [Acidimicrobiia bacterium]
MNVGLAISPTPRAVRIGGNEYPLVLPSWRDPRLHLAAVITTLQVLGQVALGFELSITQILVALLTCAVLEVVIVFRRQRVVAWPASALLTGNGVAFILRVAGTEHGDWWSARGWWIFAGTAAVSLGSKYVIRYEGGHVFNPSNLGLVLCFLALGTKRVNPLDLWWGPLSPALVVALVVIGVGAVVILGRLRMAGVAAGFWVTFAAGVALLAVSGHAMTARWHVGPVEGWLFWRVLVTSPEILVFLCFMITDPKTTPRGRVARATFGAAVGVLAAVLIATQTSEFGVKVSILTALALVCAVRPLVERVLPEPGATGDRVGRWMRSGFRRGTQAGPVRHRLARMVVPAVVGTAIVAVLVSAGGNVASPTAPAVDVARPDLGRRLPIPEVVVDTTSQVVAVDPSVARVMARDTVEDLAIQSRALRTGNARLAATAADRAWLVALRARIRRTGHDGSRRIPVYRVDRVTIATARRPFQGPPAILATVRGRRWTTPVDASQPTGAGRPFGKTFEIAWAGGDYLLVSDVLPPGWSPPR